jgi:eukaryotic-like serine/threonine-protein kinase
VAVAHTCRVKHESDTVAIVAEAHSFGRYRVTGTLGAGAMGEVFAAIDDVLGREVAVKTLRARQSGLAARWLDERFRHEARAIAQLSHPGVVQVFDIDLAANPPYIVMERVAGPSLKERLATGAIDPAEVRALGIQIARALAAAHAGGIVHRDVKPANILAATGGMWKLADFGVAHVPDSSLTMTGQFVGSPAYAAPEALVRGETGPAGDVYGLGATLYEAALGRWPRADATTGALFAPSAPLATLAPEVPTDLAAAIDRAVAIEPAERPTAAELAELLARGGVTTVAATGAHPVSLPMPRSSGAPVRWKPFAAGAIAMIAIIAIIAIASRDGAPSDAAKSEGSSARPERDDPAPRPERPRPERPGPDLRPGEIRARYPQAALTDRRAAKDWGKLVDKLYRRDWREALDKLDEFERRYGESEETSSLRAQLEAIPELDD